MLRVVHLSDPHFGPQLPGLLARAASGFQGHDPQAVFELGYLIADLSDELAEGSVFRVAVTGDLTVAGTKPQFDIARGFIGEQTALAGNAALGLVTAQFGDLLIPGNHDYGPRRLVDSSGISDHFADFFGPQPHVAAPIALGEGWSVRFLSICTSRDAGRADLVRARGACRDQIRRLRSELGRLGTKPAREVRVLLLHHAPSFVAPGPPYLTEIDKESRDDLALLIIDQGIDGLLSGHTHAASLKGMFYGQGRGRRRVIDATCGSSAKRTRLKAGGPQDVTRDRRLSVVVHDLHPEPDRLTWTVSLRVRDVGPFRTYHRGSPRMQDKAFATTFGSGLWSELPRL